MTEAGQGLGAHPVRQPRSQATLERLLNAAELALARDGLEGATVPAIARRARVAVGSVYRRFPDKDALMRAVYLRFFSRAAASNRAALDPEKWTTVPAGELVRTLVHGMVCGYREKRQLLRALLHYGERHPDAEFRRQADELRLEAFGRIGDLLLERRAEISHPDPPGAVRLALTVLALSIQGLILRDEPAASFGTDEQLSTELSRLVLAYLRIPQPPTAS